MTDLDLLYFEQLKILVQAKYLENHSPSYDDISRWKGIDIVYFQEDLRKKAKGNISEKTFYTYFKTSPVSKLPRIDMLNLLSLYVGFASWYEYKKLKKIPEEILEDKASESEAINHTIEILPKEEEKRQPIQEEAPKTIHKESIEKDEQMVLINPSLESSSIESLHENLSASPWLQIKKYLWIGVSIILACLLALLIFYDRLFEKTYEFKFVDADRSQAVQNSVEIKVLKAGESPITYRVKPNENFIYSTKDKNLKMVVSSIFYRTDTLIRNLENAPEIETIELKPNEYNMMLYSYSTSKDFKRRRAELGNLISDKAIIYQVFDNQYFNVETMTKQRYIDFLSLPTTSLENLDVIETKIDKGKIVLIKFRIKKSHDEIK